MISFVTLARAAWTQCGEVLTVFLCVGAAGPGCGCRLRWPGEDTGQVSSSRSGDLATSGPRDTASADESWMEDQLLPIISYQLAASAGEY